MITITEYAENAPAKSGIFFHWNGHSDGEFSRSLLKYVEDNDGKLKRKYVEFINNSGLCLVNNKTIIDTLKFSDGFSYWWMLSFVQSNYNSFINSDILRLLALEEIIINSHYKKIVFKVKNHIIQAILRKFCKNIGVVFQYTFKKDNFYAFSIKKNSSVIILSAILYLIKFIIFSLKNRKNCLNKLHDSKAIFICQYFENFNREKLQSGLFYSNYWPNLDELIHSLGLEINWLHHGVSENNVEYLDNLSLCNSKKNNEQHLLLHSFSSFRVYIRIVKKLFSLMLLYFKIHHFRKKISPLNSSMNFSPLLQPYFKNDFLGCNACANLIVIELFKEVFETIPKQILGFYLYENNHWEMPFIFYWKKNGHGKLCGVAHTSIRFWDIRYFKISNSFLKKLDFELPAPEVIIVNGKEAFETLSNFGTSSMSVIICEALRYNYLIDRVPINYANNTKSRNILILGDVSVSSTEKMLSIISLIYEELNSNYCFYFKPHPASNFDAKKYFFLNRSVEHDSFQNMNQFFSFICITNSSSSVLDAYFSHSRFLVMLDPCSVNFSPARSLNDIKYFSSSYDLKESILIKNSESPKESRTKVSEYFFLDVKLKLWSEFIKNSI